MTTIPDPPSLPYSPAASTLSLLSLPPYSASPHPSEETLVFSPRSQARTLPTGTFTKRAKHATVVLNNQDDDASMPLYSGHSFITGEIALEKKENVVGVEIKLQATLATIIPTGGKTMHFVQDSHTLYKAIPGSSTSTSTLCPALIPFDFPFPATFRHTESGEDYPLPPSLKIPLTTDSTIFYAEVEYWLIVTTTHPLSLFGLNVTSTTKEIRIPITYIPRIRPRGNVISLPFYSSLKTHTSDWRQISSKIDSKSPEMDSLDVDLFVPSVQVFPLRDSIHFHLQISGGLSATQELYRIITAAVVEDGSSETDQVSLHPTTLPPLRVFLLRQLVSEPNAGQRGLHNIVLGEGELRSLPPSIDSKVYPRDATSLGWEGELQVDPEKAVYGSFHAGYLQAKDFIMVSFNPKNSESPQLKEHKFYQAIRLVTDPWAEPAGYRDDF